MLSIVENIVRFLLNALTFSLPIVFICFFMNQLLLVLKKDKVEENKLLKLRSFVIGLYVTTFFILIIILLLVGFIGGK